MKAATAIGKTSVWVTERFNPITSSPAAPLKTRALLASFGPSLMPRAAMHQGMAAGMSVLAADLVASAVDASIRRLVPATAPLTVRLGARAAVAAAGLAVSRIPETDDESTAKASVRSAGRLVAAGVTGGMLHQTSIAARERYPAKSPVRPVIVGAAGLGAVLVYSGDLLKQRQSVIKRWTENDKPATLGASIGIALGVTTVGRGIGRGYLASRRGMSGYFGPAPTAALVGRLLNDAIWAGSAISFYSTVVGLIARSNKF